MPPLMTSFFINDLLLFTLIAMKLDFRLYAKRKQKKLKRDYLKPLVGMALLSAFSLPVLAAGTPAGLTIDNTAFGSFENPNDAGTAIPVNSNTVTLTVAEIAGIDVAGVGATEAPFGVANAGPGQGDGAISSDDVVYFTYTITNIGNDQTQLFIPGVPANVINGTFDEVATGPIEIVEYNDGVNPPVALNVAVPVAGDDTGTLIPAQNGGSLPVDGSITVRVPIKLDSGLDINNDTITVVLGNTVDAASQNFPFVAGGEFATANADVFTQDNTGTANGDASATNPTPEREASDVIVTALGTPSVDYGDAPDPAAGTAAAPDAVTPADYETVPGRGPSHVVDNTNFLGTGVDVDTTAFDDAEDDGVELGGSVLQGQTVVAGQAITLDVSTASGTTGLLNAWIDFNRDGDFDDPGEQVATDASPTADTVTINTTVPFSATDGVTYARFRYSTAGGLTPTSAAPDGEVEDYEITISASTPALRLVKRVTRVGTTNFTAFVDDGTPGNDDNAANWPSATYLAGEVAAPAEPGEEVDYTIYYLSDGNTPINNISICDFVPDNTTYVANSMVSNLGNAGDTALTDTNADADGAQQFAVGATPGAPCPGAGNTDGGVLINIPGTADNATAPGTPTSSFGYVRFTVVVD